MKSYETQIETLQQQLEQIKTVAEEEKVKDQEKIVQQQVKIEEQQIELQQLQQQKEQLNNNVIEEEQQKIIREQVKEQMLQRVAEISTDQDKLTAECIKHVISILSTQKIWLGVQLGVTRDPVVKSAYAATLTPQQLDDQLGGVLPDNYIRVLQVTDGSVSADAGVRRRVILLSLLMVFIFVLLKMCIQLQQKLYLVNVLRLQFYVQIMQIVGILVIVQ
eukprot:UN04850